MGKRKEPRAIVMPHGKPTDTPTNTTLIDKKKKKKRQKINLTVNQADNEEQNTSLAGDESFGAGIDVGEAHNTTEAVVKPIQEVDAEKDGVEAKEEQQEKDEEGEVAGEEEKGDNVPPPIQLTNFTFDIQFHPNIDLFACSDVSGRISLYQYGTENTRLFKKRIHKESCRSICFSGDGNYLFSGSTDRSLKAIDMPSGNVSYTVPNAHKDSINAIATRGNFICSGDDTGVIKFWDTRQANSIFEYTDLTDFVSDIHFTNNGKVLATSADGQLSIFSLANQMLLNKVDELDDELLCLADTGRYIVMGSQSGVIGSVKWGEYEQLARMDNTSHSNNSVDAILPYDPTTVFTGCSDGIIRVVKVVPSKILHIVGDHDGYMIERLGYSQDKSLLASVGQDNFIKFWDIKTVFNRPTKQEQEANILVPEAASSTTNIFTNIFNTTKDTTTPNYNSINYTLNNTLTTTVPTLNTLDEDEPKKKKAMKKGKIKRLVKAKFYNDL